MSAYPSLLLICRQINRLMPNLNLTRGLSHTCLATTYILFFYSTLSSARGWHKRVQHVRFYQMGFTKNYFAFVITLWKWLIEVGMETYYMVYTKIKLYSIIVLDTRKQVIHYTKSSTF